MESCRCESRGYVRALEEDDFGFPDKIASLAETPAALLGRCSVCGAWWERLPHHVYGNAWYRTDQSFWRASGDSAAVNTWLARRRSQEADG